MIQENIIDTDSHLQTRPNCQLCNQCKVEMVKYQSTSIYVPVVIFWPIKPEEEDYWFLDGSVKPVVIKISQPENLD